MLHIILLILKIIGWILLAILGLLVLLICVTIFVPFRYRGDGSCKGSLESLYGKIRFSWLGHLISGFAVYENGKLDWTIRIAWKKLRAEHEAESFEEAEEFPYEKEASVKEERKPSGKQLPAQDNVIADRNDIEDKKGVQADDVDSEAKLLEKLIAEDMNSKETYSDEQTLEVEETEQTPKTKTDAARKAKNQYQKIQKFYEKLKYTFHKICDTIKSLLEKKETLETFITDEVHKSALGALITEIKRLLRFLKPRKFQADVHFGFDNPCTTGQVLAVLSVIYPLIGEHADIQPDFEQKILEGNIMISGKIRVLYAVIMGWNLIWNKNVRITFKHIRNFKL